MLNQKVEMERVQKASNVSFKEMRATSGGSFGFACLNKWVCHMSYMHDKENKWHLKDRPKYCKGHLL